MHDAILSRFCKNTGIQFKDINPDIKAEFQEECERNESLYTISGKTTFMTRETILVELQNKRTKKLKIVLHYHSSVLETDITMIFPFIIDEEVSHGCNAAPPASGAASVPPAPRAPHPSAFLSRADLYAIGDTPALYGKIPPTVWNNECLYLQGLRPKDLIKQGYAEKQPNRI
jgi:hypothetical protein